MKRFLKLSLMFVVCAFSILALVGCGISQSYADEINKAAEEEKNITYDEVVKKLGDPTIDLRIIGSGVCTWIKGVSAEEFTAMTNDFIKNGNSDAYKDADGKDSMSVTFSGGKATSASFAKYENKEK